MAQDKAPKTINGIMQLLTAIINHSIKEKDLQIASHSIKRLKTDDKRERYLTTNEVNLLMEVVRHDSTVYHFVRLALITGARLEGVLNIKKKDIGKNTITIADLKSGSTYNGFYGGDYAKELQALVEPLSPNDFVVGASSVKIPQRTIQNRLQPVINNLFNVGLDKRDAKNRAVIHSLRHTFASHLAINGTPIFTIQKLMNHTDIKMTLRYAKLAPDSGLEMVMGLYK
jgi:integrase